MQSKQSISTHHIQPKITIILLGELHRDPANTYFIKKYLEQLKGTNIPVMFLHEGASDETPEMIIKGNSNVVTVNNFLLQKNSSLSMLAKGNKEVSNLKLEYFKLQDRNLLKKAIIETIPQFSNPSHEAELERTALQLLQCLSYPQRIAMFKTIQDKKIPAYGLEATAKERESIINKIYRDKSNTTYVSYEEERINTMADNLLRYIQSFKEQGGVVLSLIGANHIQNLTRIIQDKLNQNKLTYAQIIPITLFSPYTIDGIESHKATLREAALYTEYKPHTQIICTEGSVKGTFSSPELDKIVLEATQVLLPVSLKKFTIPKPLTVTDQQAQVELVEMLGGKIEQETSKYRLISIDSNILKKPQRELLGIGRVRVTLASKSEDAQMQLKLLKQDKMITIEKEGDKFLLTYPNAKSSFVESVILNYDNFIRDLNEKTTQLAEKIQAKGWQAFLKLQEKIKINFCPKQK